MKLVILLASFFSINAFAVKPTDLVGEFLLQSRGCDKGGEHEYPLTAADGLTYNFQEDGVFLLTYKITGKDGVERDAGSAGYWRLTGTELALEDVQMLLPGIGWTPVAGAGDENTAYYQVLAQGSRVFLYDESKHCPAGQRSYSELRKK